MKPNLKQIFFIGLLAVLLVLGFWQKGKFNLPAEIKYGIRYAWHKISQAGKVKEPVTVRLDAQPHRQEHSLSCEVAALKIALSAVGVDVSESELIQKLKFDPTPKNGNIWGDPQKGFVGDIAGKMPATGYGVYDQPIAELANNWKKAKVLEEKTPEGIAAQLLAGRPVVVWGFYGRGQKLSWNTPAGHSIAAVNGEHARTVIGFTGDATGPHGFILLDPIFGEIYWTTEKLLDNWEALDRMAVVIYPE